MNQFRAWILCPYFLFCCLVNCTQPAAVPTDTLVVAISSQPSTLDPRYATDAYGMRIGSLIFSSLVHLGPNLEAEPDAAENWTYANRTYKFYLRPGLSFHNGRRVTKADLEFSFAQYLKPGGSFSSMLDIIKDVVVSTEHKDEHKDEHGHEPGHEHEQVVVEIKLKNFSDKFLKSDLPAIKILPKKEIEESSETFARTLIGCGPYRFEHQDNNQIELAADHAKSRHLIFKVIRDDFTRFQRMLKGDIDVAQMEISPDRVHDFQIQPERFKVQLYPGLSMTYLLLNFKDPTLQKVDLRNALTQSIARDEIIKYKMAGLAREATTILTPENKYFNPNLKNLPFDVEQAHTKIAALHLAATQLILKTSNTPQAIDNGKVLAYQMSRSGLDIQLQSFEWSTFYQDIKQGNFQLAIMRWVGSVDPDIFRLAFHSSERPPGRNRGSYSRPELDRLLDAGTQEEDVVKRRAIFLKVQALIHKDLAIIPLWYDQQIAISKANVLNYKPTSSGDFWPLAEAFKK